MRSQNDGNILPQPFATNKGFRVILMNSVWIALTHFTQCTGPRKQNVIKISTSHHVVAKGNTKKQMLHVPLQGGWKRFEFCLYSYM